MTIEQMAHFIACRNNSKLFKISDRRDGLFKQDEELQFINTLIDDQIINDLLSYDGYSPCMRSFFSCNMLRAELLKSIKFPEISYRKYCRKDYMGMEQKMHRAFIGLPLNKKKLISHVQLSQFRASLTFTQMMNLMVYILHHFYQCGILKNETVHCIDSTELAVDCQKLLASIEIKGKKIRIYNEIDCDCGKRRKKRDKSVYVVGYRMHTLTAIDAHTGHCFPLISLLAPANHHDSLFLSPLVKLGQAIGLDLKLITADEAYHDKNGDFYNETKAHLITPPRANTTEIPDNVDFDTMQVRLDDMCEFPMQYIGIEDEQHEFKCGAQPGECFRSPICPQYRHIPLDSGHFQRIPYDTGHVLDAIEIRKNGERPFNLMKKREGLETVRVRSQHGLLTRSVFTNMVTLMLEMAGTRKKEKKCTPKQQPLQFAA